MQFELPDASHMWRGVKAKITVRVHRHQKESLDHCPRWEIVLKEFTRRARDGSGLEVLILIQAASLSAAKRRITCCRSCVDKANRTTWATPRNFVKKIVCFFFPLFYINLWKKIIQQFKFYKPYSWHNYVSLFKSLISQHFQFPIQIFVRGYFCHSLISLINHEWKEHFKKPHTMVFNLCKTGCIQKQSMPQSTLWCSDKSAKRWKEINLTVAHHLCKMDKKRDKIGRLLIQLWVNCCREECWRQ